MIAAYIVMWTMFVGSICIFILHFLIKRTDWLIRYGLKTILLSAFLIILRLFLPYEFKYVLCRIEMPSILFTLVKTQYLGNGTLLLTDLILYIYFIVTPILLIQYIVKIYQLKTKLWNYSLPVPEAEAILQEIDPNCPIVVRSNSLIKTPLLTGNHNSIIYLPEYHLNKTNLFHILLHEYTHWKHFHPRIKEFTHIIRILLWWNPFAYLLERDIAHLLELICDDIVSQYYNEAEKISYMNTILHCLISASRSTNSLYADQYFIGFARKNKDAITKQRFHYQLTKDNFKGKPLGNLIVYSVIILCFIGSYVIVVQPFFSPELDHVEENVDTLQDIYLEEQKDGNYIIYMDGQNLQVPRKDVDDGLYSVYKIIPYEKEK